MSDFQDRAYVESVSVTRGVLIGAAAGLVFEVAVVAGVLVGIGWLS